MRSNKTAMAACLAGLLALPVAHARAEGPISAGEVMGNSCLTCHGSKGQGPGSMPSIRDFTEEGLVNKLMTFREGRDEDATVMERHATGYSEEQIRAIAAYIANLD
ncbi:MAG: c-type cytochrome [Thiohalorhabdus sp.]|uniref:c-type cytochrome n=1 Tax=Thiohalorhabdus sp. TaxID=3094134 RepID=UPI00397EFCA5